MATIKTQNMTTKSISAISEKYADSFKGANKGAKYVKTLDGALDATTKFWSHGYDSAFVALAITTTDKEGNTIECKSMKTLRPWIKALIEKHEGLDSRMLTIVKNNKGEEKILPCVWGAKALENTDVTPIIDAKGKKTYPNILTTDAKGKDVNVKVDAPKAITAWTPDTIHLFIAQNMALLAGEVTPYTEEDFHNDYDVDSTNHAVAKVATAPTCPLTAKTPTTSMTA